MLAHRGSGPLGPEPENTLAAFGAARDLGADGVELDVRRSADRQLVVHHDARLADGRLICELGAREIPSEIPSLTEALGACGGLIVNVEVKNVEVDPDFDPTEHVARASAELLVELSEEWGLDERAVVSSFSRAALRAVLATTDRLETAYLIGLEQSGVDMVAAALEDGVQGVHPHDWLVTASLVEAAHAAGLAVRPWTVDDPARLCELGGYGVEAVVTNDVTTALAALR